MDVNMMYQKSSKSFSSKLYLLGLYRTEINALQNTTI